jgi:hypothetical protein
MKDRGGRSREMEALNAEALAKIEPTDPSRIAKQAARRKIESRSRFSECYASQNQTCLSSRHALLLGFYEAICSWCCGKIRW